MLDDMRSVELPSISNDASHTPSLPPLRSLGSRRLLLGGERSEWADLRTTRYRPLNDNWNTGRSSNVEDMERLEDANSHARALLDYTDNNPILPVMTPRTMSPPLRALDHHDDGRRVKRRRVDSDKSAQVQRGFRYGKYGQSEPGQLKMEVVSCDGGTFDNACTHVAENILRDDTSVYCTRGNRCNIVLQHQGSTAFSLEELVIRAPASGYSSPYVPSP
jgi:hypothetical protein